MAVLIGALPAAPTGCATSASPHALARARVHEPEVVELVRASGVTRLWMIDRGTLIGTSEDGFNVDIDSGGTGVRVSDDVIVTAAHVASGESGDPPRNAFFADWAYFDDYGVVSGEATADTDVASAQSDPSRRARSQAIDVLSDWAVIQIRAPSARSIAEIAFDSDRDPNGARTTMPSGRGQLPRPRGLLELPIATAMPPIGTRVEVLGFPGGRVLAAYPGHVGAGPSDDPALDLGDEGCYWIEVDESIARAASPSTGLLRGISGGLVVLCHDHPDGTTTYEAGGIPTAGRLTWSFAKGRRLWIVATRYPPEVLKHLRPG